MYLLMQGMLHITNYIMLVCGYSVRCWDYSSLKYYGFTVKQPLLPLDVSNRKVDERRRYSYLF